MENEPIDITKEELMQMVIDVKSVTSKRRGSKMVYVFTLQDGQVITV
jgi:hypothetical protein